MNATSAGGAEVRLPPASPAAGPGPGGASERRLTSAILGRRGAPRQEAGREAEPGLAGIQFLWMPSTREGGQVAEERPSRGGLRPAIATASAVLGAGSSRERPGPGEPPGPVRLPDRQ
jgi:hypothetical protein